MQFSYNDKQSKTHCILAYLSSPQTCAAGTSGTSGQTGPLRHKRMKKQCSSCIPEILNCSAGHILDQPLWGCGSMTIHETSDVHGQDERGLRADGTVAVHSRAPRNENPLMAAVRAPLADSLFPAGDHRHRRRGTPAAYTNRRVREREINRSSPSYVAREVISWSVHPCPWPPRTEGDGLLSAAPSARPGSVRAAPRPAAASPLLYAILLVLLCCGGSHFSFSSTCIILYKCTTIIAKVGSSQKIVRSKFPTYLYVKTVPISAPVLNKLSFLLKTGA